jgi:dephospho-CoA kinase
MEVWGVTGVIGSGKTTLIRHLESAGYPVIDADQVSRLVVDRNTDLGREGFSQVYKAFGAAVLDNLGNLDRKALRRRMMQNPHERDVLEKILHPLIIGHISKTLKEWKSANLKLGFIEGSRLIESGFANMLAGLVLVVTDEKNRIKRVMKRDSMGKDEVTMMMELQNEEAMKRYCKIQLKNNGKPEELFAASDVFVADRLAKMK